MSSSPHVHDVDRDSFHRIVVEGSRRCLVLVDFWAEWCGPCRTLTPILIKLVEEHDGAVVLAKVNTDEQQALATEFGIRSLPTVLLVRNTEVVEQFSGVQPESTIRALMDQYVERESDRLVAAALAADSHDEARRLFARAMADDPQNFRVHTAFAGTLVGQREFDEAERVLALLPAPRQEDDDVKQLMTQVRFGRRAIHAPPADRLERSIAENPDDCEARYELSAAKLQAEDYDGAMEQLLEIVRRDRRFRDDAGRKGLIEIFELLGNDNPLVSHYRSLMAAAMY